MTQFAKNRRSDSFPAKRMMLHFLVPYGHRLWAFTGLALPELNAGTLTMAAARGGIVNNSRSVHINAKNDDDLADTVVHWINEMLNEDGSVWGKEPCIWGSVIVYKIRVVFPLFPSII